MRRAPQGAQRAGQRREWSTWLRLDEVHRLRWYEGAAPIWYDSATVSRCGRARFQGEGRSKGGRSGGHEQKQERRRGAWASGGLHRRRTESPRVGRMRSGRTSKSSNRSSHRRVGAQVTWPAVYSGALCVGGSERKSCARRVSSSARRVQETQASGGQTSLLRNEVAPRASASSQHSLSSSTSTGRARMTSQGGESRTCHPAESLDLPPLGYS